MAKDRKRQHDVEDVVDKNGVVVVKTGVAGPEPIRTIGYLELYRYRNRADVAMMAVGLVAAFAAGAAFPLTTVIFGDLVDTFGRWTLQTYPGQFVTADQLADQVASKVIYFVYLAIVTLVATYIYMSSFVYTSERQTHVVREQYLRAVIRQNIGWFDHIGAGEVATRITTDTLLIQDGIGEKVPLAFNQVATFISGFVIAFIKSWRLTLVLLSVVPLIIISAGVMNLLAGRFQTRILNLYSAAGSLAEETISSARTVIAFNAQKKMSKRYAEGLAGARREGIKKSLTTGVGLGFLFFLIYCAYSLAFYYGYTLLRDGLITAGEIVNVFFAVLIGAFALGQVAPDVQAFALGRGAGSKIFQTIDRVPSIDPYDASGERIAAGSFRGRIELKAAEFTYPARPDVKVLKGVNLVIEPGTTVALVGQSGSGKSTIIQLVERFYDPENGTVELDGVPLNKINVAWLRQQIGLVSQEPVLFEGTVADNVAFGLVGSPHENAPADKKLALIQDACRQANAHDFITKLPQGYDTQVGERGLLLSGGQKQRIAIARAIIKNPRILLLDEATSALDTTSERVVQEALDRVSKSRTTITIAHRLSTIKNADKIVVMVRGEIIEQGNHGSLVAQKGLYARLVEAQQLNTKKSDSQMSESDGGKTLDDPDALPPQNVEASKDATLTLTRVETQTKDDLESGIEGQAKMSAWAVMREIMILNMPELKFTIPGLVAAIGSGMVYPIFAIAFAEILQTFSERGEALERDSKKWALVFFAIAIGTAIFSFAQNAFFGFASEMLTERIRKLVFASILRQDIAFFDDEANSTGVLTSNLSTDAQKVQGASGTTLGTILQVSINLIGGIVIALIYGWKLALVATTVLPILIGAGIFRMRILTYFAEKSKKAYERSAQVACEAVAAIRTVQSLTREGQVHEKYLALLEEPLRDGFKNAYLNTMLYAFSQTVNFLVNALVFWYGGRLIAYEGYTIKQMFTVFVAIIFGSQGAGRIFAYAPDLTKAKDAGESIIRLLRSKPLIDSESADGERLDKTKVQGNIEFRDVKFSYPTRRHIKVLRGLNATIKPGQFAALVGPSGCGKSTTVGLIERFYDAIGGQVLIDGKDVSKLNVASYREVIGLVSQEPNLFDFSIRENLSFGCQITPTQEEIEAACKEANIHDFIMTLPDGYDTKVGAKGGQLSGGQKQRIAIARALVRKPKILLLDEATSALDAESEKVVQEALDKAAKGRTTIAIAHRLSTIQKADVIFVLKDGVVAEQGTHAELFARQGLYYELVIQQDLEAKKDGDVTPVRRIVNGVPRVAGKMYWSRRAKKLRDDLTQAGVTLNDADTRTGFARVRTLAALTTNRATQHYQAAGFSLTSGFFTQPLFDQPRSRGTRLLAALRMDGLWTARTALRIQGLLVHHPFNLRDCILCNANIADVRTFAHLVIDCVSLARIRHDAELEPFIDLARRRLGAPAALEDIDTWLLGGATPAGLRLNDWLVGRAGQLGDRGNRPLAARLADFLGAAYTLYQAQLWQYHRARHAAAQG
ncbi:hypothetical protein HK105_208915 [Polyrhizophydium stewartii]|uniref:Uncharacterized protein n=1 Tax=Polyrhizophydium stewartii TaxID=2732419 RepID=A0ABR4MWL4_9FUNG